MSRQSGQRVNPSASSSGNSSTMYPHVSTYRFAHAELQLHSPSIQRKDYVEDGLAGPIAVFGEHDHIGGKVVLTRGCHHTGKLCISVEGTLTYSPNQVDGNMLVTSPRDLPRRQHTFFSTYSIVHVVPPASLRSSSRTGIREAFIKKRPSTSSLDLLSSNSVSERSFPFGFDITHKHVCGEGLPPSFKGAADPGPSCESLEIGYKVKVIWEAAVASEIPVSWEVPILIHHDTGFQSVGVANTQEWLEMPLRSDRPIPFRSAITLPTSLTFSRASSIPYFVVFATTPRSPELAKEIAADATISVSLVRHVNVLEHASPPPTPPDTPTSSSEESDASRNKIFKRTARAGHSRIYSRINRAAKIMETVIDVDKPLPQLPIQTVFTQSFTLENHICIGFPKRPRLKVIDERGHPSLNSQHALPDGLHRSKFPLQRGMLPCIDWAGVSIKYYLDVSVLAGQHDLRARIPVKII